ncbi:alpha-2-macroglobulin-like isoform X2 [Sinocyclocheilus grahami]|uniref:alpha-2-macroglobulin-like isoform X2 n=1 Tax=Sinocyclocheilus grahami TaxID=75366 RepID=UPI0007AD21C4|nr:PREDICTED: alpha-2-macroglobulin-like isoform X2 [Sinocyclocheilus grahami]
MDRHQDLLPKFDVTLIAPLMYSVGDVGLKVEACANYTYGQPVPGQALVEVCREPFPYAVVPGLSRVCLIKTAMMNKTGCVSLTISTSMFFNTKFGNDLQDLFLVNVNVTEEGTDVMMSKSTTVSITFEVGKVTFLDLPGFFTYGSIINGKISASYFNGTPIASKAVHLLDGSQWPNKLLLNLTTNMNGLAAFSLNTADLPKADLNLVASATSQVVYGYKSPYFSTDTRTVPLFQTATPNNPTFSELTIVKFEQPLKCGAKYPVTVKYSFVGETGDYSADIIYMVLSRGVIVLHGFQKVQVRALNALKSGTVPFELSVSLDMAPVVQILAFCVLPSENVVAASAAFDTEMCFQNQVSLQFSPPTAVPSEGNVLTVSAQAGSLCGLSAVDQSIRIMEPGRRLSAQAVFDLLPVRSLSDLYPVEDEQECLNVRPRRAVPAGQAYEVFKSVGIKVATNLPVQEPHCLMYRDLNYYRNFHHMYFRGPEAFAVAAAPVGEGAGGDGSSSFDVTVRTYFPETWIWQLAQVGNTGSTRVPLKVPDTITTWETEAFCLSSKGFGLAPPVQLTVFQPFFLELSLPYSIIRGESFELKATVFNYLSKCIMVKVTPASSLDFSLRPLNEPYSSCLCANGRKTFKWILSASVLGSVNVTVSALAEQSQVRCGTEVVTVPTRGRIDLVTRSLLVLPEGVERIFTQSWLLCPKGSLLSEDVSLTFPTNVIQGSAKCSVSVLGDIMGRALKNLDNLLQMPSGCGEQNMIVLAPNIYILQYLEATGQLTPTIRQTAIGYLQSGYQGQLNYRHSDGSYSTFGYDASNTWLTAFVMRSFGLARRFSFIDPSVLQSAKDWLIGKQGSDGCFMQQGTLYHNDMKGGVGDNVTMTGYVVASLLELGVLVTDPIITNALSCLRPVVGNLGNTYTTALLAYTFSLAGETSTRAQLLNALDNVAISEGTKLHWSQTTSGDTLAVEISSYVLLAVLSVQPLTTANLGYANRIVNWLVAHQNPYGGFSSTQDTVVALHALSLLAAEVFSLEGSSTVTVQSSSVAGEVYNFNVNRDNRLLYQEKPLKNVPGRYSVRGKGSTCVSVQVACLYNIPTPIKASRTLSVEVKVARDCKVHGADLVLNITVKYNGAKPTTNMVIVNVKLLSGFTADTSLLGSPLDTFAPLVQRVDTGDDHVLVYLKEVPKGAPVTYRLQLKQVLAVQNLKPAVVEVYDYYQPSDVFETTYMPPCP